jgi:hypothetical protein
MQDIEGFTVEDCEKFYRTYYAPNNATLVIVGDFDPERVLGKLQEMYGGYRSATIPDPPLEAEPEQTAERRLDLIKLTPTWKLNLGYRSPAWATPITAAQRAQRSVVRGSLLALGQGIGARSGDGGGRPRLALAAARIRACSRSSSAPARASAPISCSRPIDEGLARVLTEPISSDELERAKARIELGLLQGLMTNEGKASTIGFYEVVQGNPPPGSIVLLGLSEIRPQQLQELVGSLSEPEIAHRDPGRAADSSGGCRWRSRMSAVGPAVLLETRRRNTTDSRRISTRSGADEDPQGLEGLTRIAGRLMRRYGGRKEPG